MEGLLKQTSGLQTIPLIVIAFFKRVNHNFGEYHGFHQDKQPLFALNLNTFNNTYLC
jgi:hypothetical protein